MKLHSLLAGKMMGAVLVGIILTGSLPVGVVMAQSSRVTTVNQESDGQLNGDDDGNAKDAASAGESETIVENSTVDFSQSTQPSSQANDVSAPVLQTQETLSVTEQPQEQAPNAILENPSSPDDEMDDSSEQAIPSVAANPAPVDNTPLEEKISILIDTMAEKEILLTDLNDQPIALSSEAAVEALGSDPWFEEDGVKHGFVKPGESCPTFIDVCHNSNENPFQAAIDSAPEGKSTTIYVAARHYEVDVVINKPQLSLMVGSVHSLFGEDIWASGEGSAVVNRMTLNYGLDGFSGITVLDEIIVANDGVRVQQAVDLIQSGGTVTVAPGVYQGFKIKKPGVKINSVNSSSPLWGAGGHAPVIQSGLADGNVGIEIDADHVSVEGFVFKSNDQAIKICSANHVNISQNTFTDNHWGVYVSGVESQDVQIHYNRFTHNNAAVENATLSAATQIDARKNWWGSNLGPSRFDIVAGDQCVGNQCGDWVIGSLDYSNWLKTLPGSTPGTSSLPSTGELPRLTGFAAASIIPVTGGQPVSLSCESRCTVLTLPGGEQIELCDLCGQQAEFQVLDENQLPDDLPEGMRFISAVNYGVQPVDGTKISFSAHNIQASLLINIPAMHSGRTFAILFWDSSMDDGIGGWLELDNAPVLLKQGATGSNDLLAQVDVQGMGLFVLVGK